MLPRVVLYDAVSLDGRTEGFAPDVDRFYQFSRAFGEDAILAGADTLLAGVADVAFEDSETPPTFSAKVKHGPRLAVVDSRGRIGFWDWLREQEYWGEPAALVCDSTPAAYRVYLESHGVPFFSCGADRVDLRAALEWLSYELGVSTVRVESGGALNTALLQGGLADEVSVLVHPALVAGDARSFVRAPLPTGTSLSLSHCESTDDGLVWLRYDVVRSG